jgi:hypothetical protein
MTLAELTAITRAGPAAIMLTKDDMLAMLEWRACVVDNIRKAQRMIKQGYAAHAEAVLNETLDIMKENNK